MKVYQKPQMLTLSLSANDMLCVGCAVTTRGNPDFDIFKDGSISGAYWSDKDGDGVLDPGESNIFGVGESCEYQYQGYCKFTAVENGYNSVFTS